MVSEPAAMDTVPWTRGGMCGRGVEMALCHRHRAAGHDIKDYNYAIRLSASGPYRFRGLVGESSGFRIQPKPEQLPSTKHEKLMLGVVAVAIKAKSSCEQDAQKYQLGPHCRG